MKTNKFLNLFIIASIVVMVNAYPMDSVSKICHTTKKCIWNNGPQIRKTIELCCLLAAGGCATYLAGLGAICVYNGVKTVCTKLNYIRRGIVYFYNNRSNLMHIYDVASTIDENQQPTQEQADIVLLGLQTFISMGRDNLDIINAVMDDTPISTEQILSIFFSELIKMPNNEFSKDYYVTHLLNHMKHLVQKYPELFIEIPNDYEQKIKNSFEEMINQPEENTKKATQAIKTYLELIIDYRQQQSLKNIDGFLVKKSVEQLDDVFIFPLAENRLLEIEKFNKLYPQGYSWPVLFSAATTDKKFYDLIPFLMAKMGITPTEFLYVINDPKTVFMYCCKMDNSTTTEKEKERVQLLQELNTIYRHAKKEGSDDSKAFGRALHDYFKTTHALIGNKQKISNDAVFLIAQYKNNHK